MNEKIKAILEPYHEVMAKVVRKNRALLITTLIAFAIFAILLIISFVVLNSQMEVDILTGIAVIGILVSATFLFYQQLRMRGRQIDFLHQDEATIYALYDAYLAEKQSTTTIVQINLSPSGNAMTNNIYFKNNLFNYMLETRTWTETVRTRGFNGMGAYLQKKIYFVEYLLKKKPLNVDAKIGIEIARMTTDGSLDHRSTFESESIAFNEMFNVNGSDLLEITKTFNPKVIDQLVTIGADLFKKKKVIIENNNAGISYHVQSAGNNPHYGLSDFNMMRLSINGIVESIIKKIERDMEIFNQLRTALSPFDFGQK